MKFNAKNQSFINCTFNEYKEQVIQTLQNDNKFDEIDAQMFEAIDKYGKSEQEKKELVQAIDEVKSEKKEKGKKPFKDKLVSFLKSNKEVFKTVFKIGVSMVIGHYGLEGADALLGLDE